MIQEELLKGAKPILFNTDMVRAIMDGRKTVTRRVVKPQHLCVLDSPYHQEHPDVPDKVLLEKLCRPLYQSGDILYVRETWFYEEHMHDVTAGDPDLPSGRYSFRYIFKADSPDYPVDVGVGANGWRPSIHMPKEAARIFLRVTNVNVERLQGITEEQAEKEGFFDYSSTANGFPFLWESTIKASDLPLYGWDADPWVWVITFERIPT